MSLDLLEKDPNNPTILNLVLDAEDGALFQAIIQYANEDNRLDNLLDSTVSYAETNQQYRSLCWLAAQENSPLFASSNSAKKVHECFIIPEAWLNTADSILLRGIFNNYEENFDAYKNHCRTLHKTELQQYVQEVSQNFEKIVQGLLNQAIKLDDPVLILDIANLYLSWSDNPNDIKNRFFSAQKLEIIGPNTLAYLISNDGLCDHELLRKELKHRYVKDPHKPQRLMNTQNPVRIALQKKYDFYQNVDRVANFYHAACRHVIEKGKSVSGQQKEFNIYKNKLQAIATEIASTLNSDATEKISAQAASVADKLIDNEYIGKTLAFFLLVVASIKRKLNLITEKKHSRGNQKQEN
ncbi:MAG: hypothetical protein LRY69_01465 [Gammaproteobacteria bacterium]|nr:hypothetical protein [Gammaproteobacteria bacterium]